MRQVTIRGSWGSALLLAVWYFLSAILFGVAGLLGKATWLPCVLCAFIGIGFVAWVRSSTIVVSDTMFEFRGFFRRSRGILLQDIAEVRLEASGNRYSDRFRPPIRLRVIPAPGAAATPFFVNAKLFRRRELNDVLRKVRKAAPDRRAPRAPEGGRR